MQPMLTRAYVRCLPVDKEGTMFQAQRPHHSKAALEWLEWTVHQLGRPLQHRGNAREKRLRTRDLPVDGWDSMEKRVY